MIEAGPVLSGSRPSVGVGKALEARYIGSMSSTRFGTTVVVLLLAALFWGAPGLAEEEEAAAAAQPRGFSLRLDTLTPGSYEASRELRLAMWDSPMARLDYAVTREMWAARMGGLPGRGAPGMTALRMSVAPGSSPRLILAGPWTEEWHDLAWQDKVAVTTQSALMIGIIAALVHNLK